MMMLQLALDTSGPPRSVLYIGSSTYCKALRTLALFYHTMLRNDQLLRGGILGLLFERKQILENLYIQWVQMSL